MVENIDFIMNSFESKELIIVTITENELNDSSYFFDHNVNKSQNQATSINQNFGDFAFPKIYFRKISFPKNSFSKVHFEKIIFPKISF